jgi:hypothetical protein
VHSSDEAVADSFIFEVEAFDDAGPFGAGEHSRAIIDTERLLEGSARRGPGHR